VGYVHAIAHNFGGLYGVPHGLANAIVLPVLLDFNRDCCQTKLARLGAVAGLAQQGDTESVLADRFIVKVREMNKAMGIPLTVNELKAEDIPLIAERALAEANPSYPVPRIMNKAQCEEILGNFLS
jgi:alcohol dehydrogenase class IV